MLTTITGVIYAAYFFDYQIAVRPDSYLFTSALCLADQLALTNGDILNGTCRKKPRSGTVAIG